MRGWSNEPRPWYTELPFNRKKIDRTVAWAIDRTRDGVTERLRRGTAAAEDNMRRLVREANQRRDGWKYKVVPL